MRRRTLCNRLVALGLAATLAVAHAAESDVSDKTRRDQLSAERAAAQTRYDQAVRECERGFAVTGCVDKAKAERRATLERVSREQSALDDAQRKRRAEERRQRIAQKQARQAEQQAEQKAEQKAAATRGAAASAPPARVREPRQPAAAASATRSSRTFEPRSAQEAAAAEADAARRAAQSQERRERAQAHEEAVRTRNAERAVQRAPAAPLPEPGASAASAIR